MKTHTRFDSLDALRGVAALAVLVIHLGGKPASFLPGGYLAVDFFYGLSGFVLSQAYGDWSLNFKNLILVRIIRLYPVYIFGTLLGLLSFAISSQIHSVGIISFLTAILLLPTPAALPPVVVETGSLYPFGGAGWSLFFELAVNFVWFAVRPNSRPLTGAVCVGAVLLAWAVIAYGSLGLGPNWATFAGGFARVIYSFFAGIGLHRIWRKVNFRPRTPFWVVALLTIAVFATPGPRAIIDLVAALVMFPAIIYLGASAYMSRPFDRIGKSAGAHSYSIYVLHVPLIALIEIITHRLFSNLAHPSLIITPLTVFSVLMGSFLLDRYYDLPIRKRLTRLLVR